MGFKPGLRRRVQTGLGRSPRYPVPQRDWMFREQTIGWTSWATRTIPSALVSNVGRGRVQDTSCRSVPLPAPNQSLPWHWDHGTWSGRLSDCGQIWHICPGTADVPKAGRGLESQRCWEVAVCRFWKVWLSASPLCYVKTSVWLMKKSTSSTPRETKRRLASLHQELLRLCYCGRFGTPLLQHGLCLYPLGPRDECSVQKRWLTPRLLSLTLHFVTARSVPRPRAPTTVPSP